MVSFNNAQRVPQIVTLEGLCTLEVKVSVLLVDKLTRCCKAFVSHQEEKVRDLKSAQCSSCQWQVLPWPAAHSHTVLGNVDHTGAGKAGGDGVLNQFSFCLKPCQCPQAQHSFM